MTFSANPVRSTAFRPGLRAWVAGQVEAFRTARARATEYNRIRDELSALTDRELADIGISRLVIDDIARDHVAL